MILNYAYCDTNKPRGVFRDDIGELLDISIMVSWWNFFKEAKDDITTFYCVPFFLTEYINGL